MESRALPYEVLILVCTNQRGTGEAACGDRAGQLLREALKRAVAERGLKGRVRVSATGCLGRCAEGPNVMILPAGVWYSGVGLQDVPAILARHLPEE